MFNTFKNYLKADQGIAAIETAFIMPIMLVLYIGMVDITRLIDANRKMTLATATINDIIGQFNSSFVKSDVDDTFKALDLIMTTGTPMNATVKVEGYRKNGGGAQKIWSASKGSCSGNVSATTISNLMVEIPDSDPNTPPEFNDLIVAHVCVSYIPYLGTVLGDRIIKATQVEMSESIVGRPRATNKLTCYKTSSYTAGNECI